MVIASRMNNPVLAARYAQSLRDNSIKMNEYNMISMMLIKKRPSRFLSVSQETGLSFLW